MQKCCQATSTYKALHNPWSQFISGLWRVSLADYLLVLRVLFPLLQMAQCIMDIARIASIPSWMRSEPWAGIFIILLSCFCGLWSCVGTVIELCWQMLLSNLIFFCYYLSNLVCNNSIHTLMNELYLWTLCNMWHVCWIMYDLGCMWIIYRDPSWYSTDYRVYMGSSMTVRPLAGCHCTCALINWSVLR